MIRLGTLVELSDYKGDTNNNDIQVELNAIENHVFKIRDKLSG